MNAIWGSLPSVILPCDIEASPKAINQQQYMEILNRLVNVALSRFKWSGLPDSCNERALEMTLLFYGRCLFFRDKSDMDLGLIHTPVNLCGNINIYYEHTVREAYSHGYNHKYGLDDSVLIRANRTSTPDSYIIFNYASKIANALRAIDVHTETIKRPFAVACDEKKKSSVINAIKNIRDNDIAVFGTEFMVGKDNEAIKVLNFGVTPMLSEMWANVKNYFNQAYNALGIANQFTEKRERMIVSESEGEANPTRHTMQSNLEARRLACKEINKMFGTHISVEANQLEEFTDERLAQFLLQYTGNQHGDVSEAIDKGGGENDSSENSE